MKLALVLLVLVPFVLAGPLDQKRVFLSDLHLGNLVDQLKGVVTSSTGHDACVTACHGFAGLVSFLCDPACTQVLNALSG